MTSGLIATATRCREILEKYARDHLRPDVPEDLCGACALGAWLLSYALRRQGFTPSFVLGVLAGEDGITIKWGDHCWAEVEGLILDITATQFGKTAVIVQGKNSLPEYRALERDRRALREVGEWTVSPQEHADRLRKRYLRAARPRTQEKTTPG